MTYWLCFGYVNEEQKDKGAEFKSSKERKTTYATLLSILGNIMRHVLQLPPFEQCTFLPLFSRQ